MKELSLARRVLPNAVTLKVGKAVLHTQKQSPHILFAAGIVGFGATVVLASRATLKVDQIIQKAEKDIVNINTMKNFPPSGNVEEYSSKDAVQDKIYVYTQTTVSMAKLYWPSVAVGILSVAALTKAHFILNSRVTALSAAYTALDKAYSAYRKHVEEELFPNSEKVLSLEGSDEDEVGKDLQTKRRVVDGYSPYSRFFDETSPNWQRNADYNYVFLLAQQNYANDMLKSRGNMFLNEIYDRLGFERSKEGAVVGWLLNGDGDGYIDFGFNNESNLDAADFRKGTEKSVRLDFNVDGLIYDKL